MYGNKTKNQEIFLYPLSHNQDKMNVHIKAKINLQEGNITQEEYDILLN
jgi:hypothetical protein